VNKRGVNALSWTLSTSFFTYYSHFTKNLLLSLIIHFFLTMSLQVVALSLVFLTPRGVDLLPWTLSTSLFTFSLFQFFSHFLQCQCEWRHYHWCSDTRGSESFHWYCPPHFFTFSIMYYSFYIFYSILFLLVTRTINLLIEVCFEGNCWVVTSSAARAGAHDERMTRPLVTLERCQ